MRAISKVTAQKADSDTRLRAEDTISARNRDGCLTAWPEWRAAMTMRGHVVVTFNVHKDGRITDDGVFVVDTMGELVSFYGCAQVAFVGGSLQDIGGHNLLEPASAGTPVVTGPHLHNFTDIANRMRHAGALRVGEDAAEVERELAGLLADPQARAEMAAAARGLIEEGRGALSRTLELLAPDLPPRA